MTAEEYRELQKQGSSKKQQRNLSASNVTNSKVDILDELMFKSLCGAVNEALKGSYVEAGKGEFKITLPDGEIVKYVRK